MWLFQEAGSLGEMVHLTSVNCDLALESAYRKVEFPSPQEEELP
jgi:hypothetical protein